LPVQFGLISTVALVVLGVVVSGISSRSIEHRALKGAEEQAQVIAVTGIEPFVAAHQIQDGFTGAELDRLDRLGHNQQLRAAGLQRLKVFDADARVVYSDDRAQIGLPAVTEMVARALGGDVGNHLTTGVNHDGHGDRMLEVYVPLHEMAGGRPAGVLEMYLPYAPVAAAIADDLGKLRLTLGIGLLLLWLSLFRVVRSASIKLRRQADDSVRQALHDSLTGLPNRTLLYERLESAYATAEVPFALLILDLDGFKEVNDSLGHHNGDLMLCEVAERLRTVLAPADTIARLGGDEFAIVLDSGLHDGAGRQPVAEQVLEVLREPFRLAGAEVRVRASVGIAPSSSAENADFLVRNADLAMYRAKAGGDHAEVFAPEMHEALIERLDLEAEMRRALQASQFALHYQPIFDAGDGGMSSLEALIRWPHAQRGMIGPCEFIPIAEQTGLISELGAWVLGEACRQLRSWQDAAVVGPDVAVSVNVSGIQLCDSGFAARVADTLRHHGLSPANLIIEVTESVLTDEHAEAQLRAIRAAGVPVALDDFGTGYSSLSRLSTLPVDHLKIDRSFVEKISDASVGDPLTTTILAIGHSLGLTVVAEGVETPEQLSALRRTGCDRVQGFLLSRPLPPDEIPGLAQLRPAAFDDVAAALVVR
ncbi:MAG: domain S-box/diguanylate cyclase protein, partial [Solirubrobacterales bacterium]|nr:domain S-box/diguanylate cyclase protein [Solirubrobacterales bacterium]